MSESRIEENTSYNTTTDLHFAAALMCNKYKLARVYRVGKRVHFEFTQDIEKEMAGFGNNDMLVPARMYGVNHKYLRATISDLYPKYVDNYS
jgi:hypothetical protein